MFCGDFTLQYKHRPAGMDDAVMLPPEPVQAEAIRAALRRHDRALARELLRPALKAQPTAELWALAARACDDPQSALRCLERALAQQPDHPETVYLLDRLRPHMAASPATAPPADPLPLPPLAMFDPPLKKARNPRRRRSVWDWVLLACMLLLGSSGGAYALNAAGLTTGFVTAVNQVTGGPAPVTEWGGIPLASVPNLPEVLPASQTESLGTAGRDTDVLDPGYTHEYSFEATRGEEVAVYVQFLSLSANYVSRNIALMRPDGTNAMRDCTRDTILEGDNNIALTCTIDISGSWRVRLTGRQHESTGAYFVGVEHISGGAL